MRTAAGEFCEVTPALTEQLRRHGDKFIRSVMLAFQQAMSDMHAANALQVASAWHAFQFIEHVGSAEKHMSQAAARASADSASKSLASGAPASGAT
jgi:hypothetical protein